MICPNSVCASTIPDESWFCDQCGKELYKCPQCGNLAVGKFCKKDGIKTVSLSQNNTPQGQIPLDQNIPVPSESIPTVRTSSPGASSSVLKLIHAGGSVLECNGDTPLGRKVGPHAAYLSSFDSVSSQHGKLLLKNGTWFFSDTGSTNGSRLNGKPCTSNAEYPVKTGDILELSNQKFQIA